MTQAAASQRRRFDRALLLAVGLSVLLPAIALAHPLGNFTVNHFARIRIEADRIVLYGVIDEAEIPTFQDRLRIDTNGDGVVSDAEAEVERLAACPRLVPDLALTVNHRRLPLVTFAAGLSFPPGTAGLSTMRLVCEYAAPLPDPVGGLVAIGFDDTSHPGRIGWHEVVVTSSGVTLNTGNLPSTSISDRLPAYPANLIPHPLDVQKRHVHGQSRWSRHPYEQPADATSLTATPSAGTGDATAGSEPSTGPGPQPGSAGTGAAPVAPGAPPAAGAVPGGVVGVDIAGVVGTSSITPLVVLASLLAAAVLGAGHALTPGHSKTRMGAYLVGSRGTALHAIALRLSVTVSHTLGIVVLAAITLQARDIAPELFNTVAPVVSGLTVIAIGGWLLLGQARLSREPAPAGVRARPRPRRQSRPRPHSRAWAAP